MFIDSMLDRALLSTCVSGNTVWISRSAVASLLLCVHTSLTQMTLAVDDDAWESGPERGPKGLSLEGGRRERERGTRISVHTYRVGQKPSGSVLTHGWANLYWHILFRNECRPGRHWRKFCSTTLYFLLHHFWFWSNVAAMHGWSYQVEHISSMKWHARLCILG